MSGARVLRACMQALVLLNLVMVVMTGAAGLHWLAPLFGLALAQPLLARYRELRAYRLLWNGAVVGLSLVLVRHAVRGDLAYVREDGLVMAVLCQVHLLNNLRSDQRPDLLFFNAFLIAIITGFMSRGVGFALLFLAFVPCFVFGLQLLNATRDGHVLAPGVTRRLARDGAARAAAVLALSVLVFVAWPRDFERKALLRGMIRLSPQPSRLEVGFDEELLLHRRGAVEAPDLPALRVSVVAGEAGDVPSLWRGATLPMADGDGWHAAEEHPGRGEEPADEPWRRRRGRLVRGEAVRATPPGAVRVRVVRLVEDSPRLFAPLEARELALADESAGQALLSRPDATVDSEDVGEVAYELALLPRPAVEVGGRYDGELPDELRPFLQLPEGEEVELALELARSIASRLPAEAEQHEVVAALCAALERDHPYLAPGTPGAARSLEEFLRGGAGAHCELFAAALATMARGLGIPCRVVTGFRSTRWDAEGRELYFGTRNAHAWVEVHDPRAGWTPADPSPVALGQAPVPGLLARLRGRAAEAWQAVTGFDAERRAALSAWLLERPARAWVAAREHPLQALGALALLGLLAGSLVRRRRARLEPGIRVYRRTLARARLRLVAGETPRELLERARTQGLGREHLVALEAATREHERARYAA